MGWPPRDIALDDLRWHWGSAYDITFDGKSWTAKRYGTGRMLANDTPYGLRDMIVTDYSAHPREAGGPEAGDPRATGTAPEALPRLVGAGLLGDLRGQVGGQRLVAQVGAGERTGPV